MRTNKATHEMNVELFAPVMKESKGKYIAVLSDTSIDRDGERVGKSALTKIVKKGGYIAALVDHENKVLNQVAQWTNMRLKELDGHTVLVAEPKFFPSNKKAKEIKGMLDEGAEIGISIGAIVKEYEEDEKINGDSMRTFTDLELLEASFVAIPSNRHGRAMLAMAKSFKTNKGEIMELTQKDIDMAVEKKESEYTEKIADFEKQLETKDSELAKLKKDVEDSEKAKDEAEEKVEESEKAVVDAEAKVAESEKKAKEAGKESLEKQKIADENAQKGREDAETALKEGKLPIMNA